jgi:hypothetical protein
VDHQTSDEEMAATLHFVIHELSIDLFKELEEGMQHTNTRQGMALGGIEETRCRT